MAEHFQLIFTKALDSNEITAPTSHDMMRASQFCAQSSDPQTLRLSGALMVLADIVLPMETHRRIVAPGAGVPRCPWCPVPDAPDPRYHPEGDSSHHEIASALPRKLLGSADPLTCQHLHAEEHPFETGVRMCADCGATVWPIESTVHAELDEQAPSS